ncbi:2OG-FeII-Oxy-2 domain-containing protein [Pyrenophora tritici-repentis]|nr:2OG-FeII-Oxy-2 domain-containing protein [Pyrenophora tritici-repentis]KAI0579547.1 2OG-FeII-Oxy-2 domain-containing protein [Pyrenophora tritici-repentis]
MHHLDPHERPPDGIRNVYKKYQKMGLEQLNQDTEIIDITDYATASSNSNVHVVEQHAAEQLTATFRAFAGQDVVAQELDLPSSIPVYEHEDMPGLHILPTLLPPEIQSILLSRLLHRDLSNPAHLTNIHTHYNLTYPPSSSSFFTLPPTSPHPIASPLNPTIHTPLPISPLLTRKLRWTTLGGQYNWTLKRYPTTPPPPPFPTDIKALLEAVFPQTRAEAAIVNLYSPRDTLSLHRDVAEDSGRGLVGKCIVHEWHVAVCVAWCTPDSSRDVSGVSGKLA